MRLEFTLAGVAGIIMHNGAAGLDARSALSREIAAITTKRGGNRTDVDDQRLRELECQRSLYLDLGGRPTLPEAALRTMIEASARKTKQGALVREGLMIESVRFIYDVKHCAKLVCEEVESATLVASMPWSKSAVRRPSRSPAGGDAVVSSATGVARFRGAGILRDAGPHGWRRTAPHPAGSTRSAALQALVDPLTRVAAALDVQRVARSWRRR